ncbi:SRPBCC family protein [Lutimonas sp.]|uniref:SRPBCC family protein n=1 Tax=Lutimonas sp. TaxID=1872403 RepID=UPI003D9AD585
MKEIKTEIIMNARPEKVWQVLTDFKAYPEWNPFITSIEGEVFEGARFKVKLQPLGSGSMQFKPVCLSYNENHEFSWIGKLVTKGVFDGKHCFELEALDNGKTKFIQREEFKGFLVPLFWKKLDVNTRWSFEMMNDKLKERVEKM